MNRKQDDMLCLRMDCPAGDWQEGFPLGNGSMGQVLHGQPFKETVWLSESSFFSGSDSVWPFGRDGAREFERMREAASREDWESVKRLTRGYMGKRGNYGTNLPVGRLLLDFGEECPVREYGRGLDLNSGLASVSFYKEGPEGEGRVYREAFSSHPDRVFVLFLQDDSEAGMSLAVTFDGGRVPCETFCGRDYFGFRERALETMHSDGREGARLVGMAGMRTSDGLCGYTDGGIRVRGAHRAVLYLAMDTDFSTDPRLCGEISEEGLLGRIGHKYEEYAALRERHIRDVTGLMGRQRLSLGKRPKESRLEEDLLKDSRPGEGGAPVRRLLEQVREGGSNERLTELMFQYGRYLLISSSREDSRLPAPLQGVWNDDVACRIGWTCDMHLDINTQMNYWISGAGNLPECREPLFGWMEKRLIPGGRENARESYGRPGWAAELVSNAWGYAAPYWNESLSPCPTGGIWQASDYMEHYRYTRDAEFLRERAYPVLREAVLFFLAYVFEDGGGHLTSGPSISPENAFVRDGAKYYASNGCTYEILMIRELFSEFLEAHEGLYGERPDSEEEPGSCDAAGSSAEPGSCDMPDGSAEPGSCDAAGSSSEPGSCDMPDGSAEPGSCAAADAQLARQVESALKRLLPYRILPDGTLAEWSHDCPSADPQHRHTSHLLGLFPYGQITPEETPALARAAERSIAAKLSPYENWEDTGWARSLLALYSARLQKGEEAYRHLRSMQEKLTGPNLLVMHPPTRGAGSFKEVYELDGNTGFSMAALEMLVQSHGGVIRLLPALPEAWSEGSLEGVAVRGGLELDMRWKERRPVYVRARAKTSGLFRFAFDGGEKTVWLKAGQQADIAF